MQQTHDVGNESPLVVAMVGFNTSGNAIKTKDK